MPVGGPDEQVLRLLTRQGARVIDVPLFPVRFVPLR